MAKETMENARELLYRVGDMLTDMDDILESVQGLVGQAVRDREELEFVQSQEVDGVFDAMERIMELTSECLILLDEYPKDEEE